MAYKLLGDVISNPTDNNINGATLVHIVAVGADVVRLEKADGTTLIGQINIPAGGSIDLVKDSTDVVSCSNSGCTPIAYHW